MASKGTRSRNTDPASVLDEVEHGLGAAERVDEVVAADVPDPEGAPEESLTVGRLKDLWVKVQRAEAEWVKAKKHATDAQTAAEKQLAQLRRREDDLQERWRQSEVRDAELARAEEEITKARLAVREGFPGERRRFLEDVTLRHTELLKENEALEAEGRLAAATLVAEAKAALDTEREVLAAREVALREREQAGQQDRNELEWEREQVDRQTASAEEKLERRHAAQLEALRSELVDLTDQVGIERDLRSRKDREARDLAMRLDSYGGDPDHLRRQVDELTERVRRLTDELARRPGEDETGELRRRAQRAVEAEALAVEWRQRFDQADRALRYQQSAVGELEILRDERDLLSTQKETLRQAIQQHRSDWEELQQNELSKDPFPACSAYDRDRECQRPADTRDSESLRELAEEVRHRMASEPETPFYFSAADVRLFLGGLAASRLHLLQGISGTGKTSLPREFFRAMGGSVTVVEVQASWRDKDDLFGYYNAFEKRFVESEFTKALYRSLLPSQRDLPTVIVLDEMNLAHPEQYFSTMLSKLENSTTENVYLDLITSQIPGLPALFSGAQLELARNVWFVGTANHDETTMAFADKTYDRSHVQELPSRHDPFQPRIQDPADPISFRGLQESFTEAETRHASDAQRAWEFLGEDLHGLFEQYGVGWGNRLERQVRRFVPTVVAAGGTVTEAVDHIVATKLVRKLEDRFGLRGHELDQLAKDVEHRWNLDGNPPRQTIRRLQDEARRLGEGLGR